MILVCPSCDTRYFADDTAIGKDGRRVRCASCGHSWFVKATDEGEAVAEPEATGLTREQVERLRQTAAVNAAAPSGPHAEFRAREHSRRQRQRTAAAFTAWVLGFGVFGASAAGLVVFREDVVNAWPNTASFYALAGFEVNRFGLVLVDEEARRSFDGTTPVLTVTGAVVNEGSEPRSAPLLRISLRDEAGVELHSWTDELGVESVAPGERVKFLSRIVAPPVQTFQLVVTFADRPAAPSLAEPAAATAQTAHADHKAAAPASLSGEDEEDGADEDLPTEEILLDE